MKKLEFLDVVGMERDPWKAYIGKLRVSHAKIREDVDELVWSRKSTLGSYTTKLG